MVVVVEVAFDARGSRTANRAHRQSRTKYANNEVSSVRTALNIMCRQETLQPSIDVSPEARIFCLQSDGLACAFHEAHPYV